MFRREQLGEDEQDSAQGNGGIGNVEGRPVIAGSVPLDEVDNGTEAHAINDVTQSAAHDQGQGQRGQDLLWLLLQFVGDPG